MRKEFPLTGVPYSQSVRLSAMIKGVLIVNNHGKARIVKFYEHVVRPYPDAEQQAVIRDIYTQVSKRSDTLCNFLEGRCLVFVETLDKCFENVCELDLIFHSDKVHYVLDEIVMGGMVLETNINEILTAVNEMNRLDSNSTKRSLPGTGKK
ncbi:hypothetical protein DYB37_005037 [Aphanomyces astaci]|uniref:AP complex mu/sigma subunit domain-containing protein n=1 Tax=Aphanomyces astaci TaxID=112090 RepID=A0A3L6ULC8_APHAT|nr:hypothetical protein DYB35_001682 [Aphanomyces astaci]RHZ10959.1 hypothetical protein DYB37_005037 [Aphanomyces astaci]RLN74090.1 hypothetical protein DYB28_005972 [Aphanomyces astaci]